MPRTGQMKHTAVSEFTDLQNEVRPITQKQALQVVAPLDSPGRPEFIKSSTGLKQSRRAPFSSTKADGLAKST